MKSKQIGFLVIFLAASMAASAQKCVVIDGDTGRPIANVSITGNNFTTVSDSTGCFSLPKDCRTLVLSHINYVSYLVNVSDLEEKVALYPSYQQLGEVMVFGAPTGKDPLADLNSRLGLNKTDAQLIGANPNGNLLGLLTYIIPKRWRTSRKERQKERLKKVLEDY